MYNHDLENNYVLVKEYVLEMAPAIPPLLAFETAFLCLSISLNIHGETVYHMRGGKGKCRDTRLHPLPLFARVSGRLYYVVYGLPGQ